MDRLDEGWIMPTDRLPEFPDERTDYVWAIAWNPGDRAAYVLQYTRNRFAKTEKGRAPRWERPWGGVADAPAYWRPLPNPPLREGGEK